MSRSWRWLFRYRLDIATRECFWLLVILYAHPSIDDPYMLVTYFFLSLASSSSSPSARIVILYSRHVFVTAKLFSSTSPLHSSSFCFALRVLDDKEINEIINYEFIRMPYTTYIINRNDSNNSFCVCFRRKKAYNWIVVNKLMCRWVITCCLLRSCVTDSW